MKRLDLKDLSRRRVLKGMLGGGAVVVALPLLDCFLNESGTALASGAPMPVRFGTYFWALGMQDKVFVPKTIGPNYEITPELAGIASVRDHINVLTGFTAFQDANPNEVHYTGWVIQRCGTAPATGGDLPGESLDVTVSRQIGATTRFQSLTATATGDVRNSYSYVNQNSVNAAAWSPVRFYADLFGPGYQDPNAPTFTPDPHTMVQRSVLSGVLEQTRQLQKTVGVADRARLDQYYTDLRTLERQLDVMLTKPKPIASCVHVEPPKADPPQGSETELVALREKMMTSLLVMAVACDQTRVFNMAYAPAQADTVRLGYPQSHHTNTHEEPIDPVLGYQKEVSWFTRRAMESWGAFVEAFTKVKEGDGTLLDNTLIYANTDVAYARIHSLVDMPLFTAGRAGGRVKTGLHIVGKGTPATRVGYTAMKVVGVELTKWGTGGNETSQEVSEILV